MLWTCTSCFVFLFDALWNIGSQPAAFGFCPFLAAIFCSSYLTIVSKPSHSHFSGHTIRMPPDIPELIKLYVVTLTWHLGAHPGHPTDPESISPEASYNRWIAWPDPSGLNSQLPSCRSLETINPSLSQKRSTQRSTSAITITTTTISDPAFSVDPPNTRPIRTFSNRTFPR